MDKDLQCKILRAQKKYDSAFRNRLLAFLLAGVGLLFLITAILARFKGLIYVLGGGIHYRAGCSLLLGRLKVLAQAGKAQRGREGG